MFRLDLVTASHSCAPTRQAARPIRLHSPKAATVGRSIHPTQMLWPLLHPVRAAPLVKWQAVARLPCRGFALLG